MLKIHNFIRNNYN